MAERISDDALVVRRGRNQPVDLERGTGTHPSGTTGVSVECASGLDDWRITVKGPRIYADFQNADAEGRLRLNCVGTTKDLARKNVVLQPGTILTLYSDDADEEGRSDDLQVTGVVEYSEAEQCWVARVDWHAIRHASESYPDRHGQHPPPVPVGQS